MENWREIKGFDGFYFISDLGNIKSLYRGEKLIKPRDSKRGYTTVILAGKKTLYVHRLVASHFICDIDDKREVNHKNGIKNDNKLSNLEIVTKGENLKHAYKIGLRKARDTRGEKHQFSKLKECDVLEIRKLFNSKNRRKLSVMFNVSYETIYDVAKRKTWKHI